ncbi:MAG: chromate transporter [Veillonellales bacterium]
MSFFQLFSHWFYIGAISFGGGAVVQFMIQERFIYRLRLLTEDEYTEIVGVGQITPGINILAYTILIGQRLAGWRGSLISVLGLVLPSAAITIALSSIYLLFSDVPAVQHALRTAFAAIFGISLITNWRNMKPILKKGKQVGGMSFILLLLVIIVTAFLYRFAGVSVVYLYGIGAAIGAIAYIRMGKRKA